MKPSKEAIEAAINEAIGGSREMGKVLKIAYAIDVEPLEKRIAELEEIVRKSPVQYNKLGPPRYVQTPCQCEDCQKYRQMGIDV